MYLEKEIKQFNPKGIVYFTERAAASDKAVYS